MALSGCLEIFEGWTVLDFPLADAALFPKACVYVWCFGSQAVPFYVGESGRQHKRLIDDYRLTRRNGNSLKKFNMPTDFCVAEAISYLRDIKKQQITLKLKASCEEKRDREKEEKQIILTLMLQGYCGLLNFLPRFDPQKTTEQNERATVQAFCEMLCDQG